MRVELLYFDDCPSWTVTDARLAQALRVVGSEDLDVERHRVETAEQAREWGFLGSPSVRINGVDLFAHGTEQVGLSCRVYSTPAGLSGSPTTAQLVAALSAVAD